MKGRLRKNALKLGLDVGMAILLVLMYNKRVFGMTFHEVGGLAVCGLFLIHKLLNFQWIKAVTTRLFTPSTPARQRVLYLVDVLLLGCFTYILISGVSISKVVFHSAQGHDAAANTFKMGHYAVSALALALTGVHVGLHFGWISQRMKFLQKLPGALRRGLAVALAVAVLAFGGYQVFATSFTRWVSSLFTAVQSMPQGDENAALPEDAQEQHDGVGRGQGGTGRGMGTGEGRGGMEASASFAQVIVSFLSILLAFAVVTAFVDRLFTVARRKKRARLVAA